MSEKRPKSPKETRTPSTSHSKTTENPSGVPLYSHGKDDALTAANYKRAAELKRVLQTATVKTEPIAEASTPRRHTTARSKDLGDLPDISTLRLTDPEEMSKPVLFYGKPSQLDDVLTFVTVKFIADQTTSSSAKAGYLASLFRGPALSWLTQLLKESPSALEDWEGFRETVTTTFELNDVAKEAQTARKLASVTQRGSVQQYALEFSQLATASKLPDAVAKAQFTKGLKPHIQRALIISDDRATLQTCIDEATRLDSEMYNAGRNPHFRSKATSGRDKKGRFKGKYIKSEPDM